MRIGYISLLLLWCSGCGSSNSNEVLGEVVEGPGRLRVTRAELGDRWPLSVDEVYVGCDNGNALWVARGKTTKERWALNGFALKNGIPDLDESGLWAPKSKMAPETKLKIDIIALQSKARSTCK